MSATHETEQMIEPGSRPQNRRRGNRFYGQLIARLVQLYVGLVLFGVSVALMVVSGLGLSPWDVLHQGIARRTDLPLGTIVIGASVFVLLLWIPLRQRPGFGTVSNAIVVGLVVNVTLPLIPHPSSIPLRYAILLVGIVLNSIATALYIGAGLGPGPRDGLMIGLAKRGLSIRVARTCIELTVLGFGWWLGGTVGIGTVLFAAGIGPLIHYFLPRLASVAAAGRTTA